MILRSKAGRSISREERRREEETKRRRDEEKKRRREEETKRRRDRGTRPKIKNYDNNPTGKTL
jgi:hypothetical protein